MSTGIATPSPPAAATPRLELPARASRKKRMLVIVNPYATTVSDRLKNLVVYALQGRYQVEAVSTQAQNHATQICREAREEGYDVVVAFGGDGTLNEVACGLAGTDVPVSVLPGGSTNVVCRTLGIPNDVVDATEHLLGLADDFSPRKIDLGLANGRHFVFSCGAGLDATSASRVDANPRLKARAGRWFYTWTAVSSFYSDYLRNPVRMRVEVEGEGDSEGVTALAQNSDPFTYFGRLPLHLCEGAALDNGTLSMAVLRRAAQRDVPTVAARMLAERFPLPDHRQIDHYQGFVEARVESTSRDRENRIRPFPVQVDGDYIGDHGEIDLGIAPAALSVVA